MTILLLLVFLQLPTTLDGLPLPANRPYHSVRLCDLGVTQWTHVAVIGQINQLRRQADGDWHLRLVDGTCFVIAEIVPTLQPASPFVVPPVGTWVEIRGISRQDREHHWPEIHPVEQIRSVPR